MNRARFIATIGPSSLGYEMMSRMVDFGVASFRINTAHADIGYIGKVKNIIDQIIADKKREIIPSILVDLKGPEIRMETGSAYEVSISISKEYSISEEEGHDLTLSQKGIIETLGEGDTILVNDGRVKFIVRDIKNGVAKVKALNDGTIRNNSRVNIPGKILKLGSLTERDKRFAKEAISNEVGYFALSFVQESQNVEDLRNFIKVNGGEQFIISKIETSSGLMNIDRIIKTSDMIMIARGDLGVELPLKEVSIIQKQLIKKAHSYGIPSIVATQILESMVENETPTRAEVSDITNAILDNADILMLSEETAIGKYPVEAVEYLNDVVKFVEGGIADFDEPDAFLGNRVAYSLSKSAKIISRDIESNILVMTKSGNTVKMLSALRPRGKIFVITPNRGLEGKLGLYNNVYPIHLDDYSGDYEDIMNRVKKTGVFEKGEAIVVTSGEGYFTFGGTNDIRVEIIGEFIGRGYATGESISGNITTNPDGSGEILITQDCYNIPKKKFDGIIFRCNPTDSFIQILQKKTRCIVRMAILKEEIPEGEMISIDSMTGIIFR